MANYKKVKETGEIIFLSDSRFSDSWESMEPGVYNIHGGSLIFDSEPSFTAKGQTDKLIPFRSGIVADVLRDVDNFFSEKTIEAYKELKLLHKLGIMMYGPHGTGKSCTARLIMEALAKDHGVISLIATGRKPSHVWRAIKMIRQYQTTPVCIFYDEMEWLIDCGFENYLLTLLDGEDSIEDTIFIGATNNLDKIPDRIRDRKSRIKYKYKITALPSSVYKEYITEKLPNMEKGLIEEMAYKAEEEKLNIDQLKNAIIDYRINGLSIDDALKGVKL